MIPIPPRSLVPSPPVAVISQYHLPDDFPSIVRTFLCVAELPEIDRSAFEYVTPGMLHVASHRVGITTVNVACTTVDAVMGTTHVPVPPHPPPDHPVKIVRLAVRLAA